MVRTSAFTMSRTMYSAMVLAILSSGILFAQDIVNTGTFTNNSGGTIKIQGSFSTTESSYGGTVEFYGTTQTVPALTYSNLKATGSTGNKTFGGSTAVTGDITVNQTSGGFVLSASDTLDLRKITTVPVTVTSGSFNVSAGTTKYATGAQVIFGTTYGNLITSSGSKTTSGAVTVSSGKTLTNSVTVDFGSYAFTGTGATFSNASGTLQSAGAVTLGSGTTVNGAFVYNAASGSQTIADATYSGTLSLSGNGTKTVGDVNLTGTYSVAGGARTYNGTFTYGAAGTQTIVGESYNNLTLSGAGIKSVNGTVAVTSALTASAPVSIPVTTTLQLEASATASFTGDLTVDGTYSANAASATTTFSGAAQTISGSASLINFTNLTLSGSAAKTSSLNLNVAGTFTPTRGINMGATAVLSITNTLPAAVGSYGTLEMVKGSMKRAIATNGTAYTFNDSATSATFTAATITDFTVKVEPGVNPTGYAATSHVNRKVTASYTGWTAGSAALTVGYLNSEKPSQNENKLRFFKGAGVKLSTGSAATKTASSASSWGAITLAGITFGSSIAVNAQLPSGTEVIMSNSGATIISIAAADWNTASTWDENIIPTSGDDVEINHAVTVNANASASTLLVNASKSLTLGTAPTILTVSGAATNNGTITVGSGTTLKVASSGSGILTNTGSITNDGTVQIGN